MKDKLAEGHVARLEIKDSAGEVVKAFSTKPDRKKKESSLSPKEGMNTVTWDMRYEGAESFDGIVLWGGGTQGPMAVPGEYTATMTVGPAKKKDDDAEDGDEDSEGSSGSSAEVTFEIVKDPRASATQEDLQKQFDFLVGVRDKLTETHKAIKRLRDVRSQIDALSKRLAGKDEYKELIAKGKSLVKKMTEVEKRLYQTKNRASQDPLNFPIRLNNRLSALVSVVSSGDNPPTDQAYKVRDELTALIDAEVKTLNEAMEEGIAEFNAAVKEADIPAVFVDDE